MAKNRKQTIKRHLRNQAHGVLTRSGVDTHKDGNRLGLRARIEMACTTLKDLKAAVERDSREEARRHDLMP